MKNQLNFMFYDLHPSYDNLYEAVIQGLCHPHKQLPPKLFYDTRGSRLFDLICETPEYYVSRVENAILVKNFNQIAHQLGTQSLLIEPGSGKCHKVKKLLPLFEKVIYMPMDVSKQYHFEVTYRLAKAFPKIPIHAVCLDFTDQFIIPYPVKNLRPIVFFPGSSISNFEPKDSLNFLKAIVKIVQPDGGLLIGVDLKKPSGLLNAAYNDAAGVTAAFNLNMLYRINKEFNGNFYLKNYTHHAFYNEMSNRIEMHLISTQEQLVEIGDQSFSFAKYESIHTENSYKYGVEEFQELAVAAGFGTKNIWLDKAKLFSVHYFSF